MLDGILPVYKEKGITSHDVVFKLRKILKMKKIGHSGTLDPEVDGLLLILLGNSTKVSDYAMELGKKYRAEICLGIKTTTEDLTGEIICEENIESISLEKIKEACESLIGEITQRPPIYSAVKVNGKKLYEYARANKFDVEIPSRKVEIYEIKLDEKSLIKKDGKIYFSLDISCGKGTYIRTLATQIGELLGVPSCMSKLRRTSTGEITLEDAIKISDLEKKIENNAEIKILPKEFALKKYDFYELPKYRAKQVMNGLRFRKNQFPDLDFNKGVVFTYQKKALALYYLEKIEDELLKIKTTFPQKID